MLFHLPDDPGQEKDLYPEKRDVAERLLEQYVEFLRSLETDEEFITPRQHLP